MAKSLPIKIDYAILSDDIRHENNGKLILVGIYASDILLPTFPSALAFQLLMHGSVTSDCTVAIKVRYRAEFDDSETPKYEVKAGGDLQVSRSSKDSNEIFVPIPKVPIEFRGPGRLLVHYQLDGGRWRPLLTKSIKLSPS